MASCNIYYCMVLQLAKTCEGRMTHLPQFLFWPIAWRNAAFFVYPAQHFPLQVGP